MGPKAKVFVPLYVYPAPEAWSPLENVFAPPDVILYQAAGSPPQNTGLCAGHSHVKKKEKKRKTGLSWEAATKRHRISAHPDVNFTVVINPGNGPGPNALPDANYTREIPKLTAYENVRLLGYVHTTYATRNVSSIRKDIQTYADWPTNSSNPNLAVRGIFFDETPQQYEPQTLSYLQGLTDFVKDLKGLGPNQFVVHNPGAVPDSRYLATADSTVVFEAAYNTFQERQGAKLFTDIADSNRTQLCAIVHSVPEEVEGKSLRGLVKEVRKVADEVYITHLSTDYYASFGDKWTEFVDLMAA
ncbi:hypothetical protein N7452_007580 [Penicillium brevicompactum]|uniref:Cell surface spherulin 4-like protein n=1 Tax=Penicillium brevicompactum TaxID=5074 RepID=A0A9W9QGZ8_PENBR|nr:hypothetical protein N7452_007580 [Penicillium brevicompactum]